MSQGHGQLLFRGDAAQGHIRAFMIAGPHPVCGVVLRLGDALEQIMPQPVTPNRPVVAFDVGILLRLARLDMVQTNPLLLGSFNHCATALLSG